MCSAARYSRNMPLSRRQFLQRVAGLAAFGLATPAARVSAQPRFTAYPFTLGIASGYPHASGMTLWTRLAPQPLAGGGVPGGSAEVHWEVSTDGGFRSIAAHGTSIASAAWGHSIHVDVA